VLVALLLSPVVATTACVGPPLRLEPDGPEYRASGLRHWEDGSLKDAELSTDHELSGRLLPEGTRVFLAADGVLESAYLSRDMVIDGIPVNGGWGKIATSFHPNGALKHVFLSEDAVIQGVKCKASLFHYLVFDADGKLIDPAAG